MKVVCEFDFEVSQDEMCDTAHLYIKFLATGKKILLMRGDKALLERIVSDTRKQMQ